MQYLLQFTFRPGEGPEEGTPEFDAEMKVWHELNEELRGVRPVPRRQRPEGRRRDDGAQDRRRGHRDRRAVRRDEGGPVLLLHPRGPRPRRRHRGGGEDAGRRVRLGRHPPDGGGRVRVSAAAGALERAYRDERAAVLATITRRLDGDLALAEDVVQDAFVAAAVDWDRRGAPERPGAWLTTTAWRKALDRLRHDRVAAAYAPDLAADVTYEFEYDESSLDDDQLRMLFACCHPALAPEARMALTLRSVGGADGAGDRARVPLERGRDGAAARARAAQGHRRADPGRRCRRTSCCPSGWRACCASST